MNADSVLSIMGPYLPNLMGMLLVVAAARILLGSSGWIILRLYKHFNIPRGYYLKVRLAVRTLIVLIALFMILLLIPGMNQSIIALVGLGLGLIVSLSSTTTIGNAVAGSIIYLTRPIREGDRVEIDGVLGDVVSLELLFVHLKTIKDEIVSIPALKVLNSRIVNYSQLEKIILHVSLTLGYELDPGKVEKLLLKSLDETEGILPDPAPFIMIRALNDYTVEYEANGYTDNPAKMVTIESKLMRNIITEFTHEGVQIMSPAYVNITQFPYKEKIMPDRVSRKFAETQVEDAEEQKKKIVEAKHKLEEKKRENIKLEEKK